MIIEKPTLIISKKKVTKNIQKMLKKVDDKTVFRPHFKTHQSIEIGNIFRENGVHQITVSSVSMALFFADNGWNNITIAFPVNICEIEAINQLAKRIQLNVLVESTFSADILKNKIDAPLGIFIKIDTGYNRTGLSYNDMEIDKIITSITSTTYLIFKGFITHAGHTYAAKGSNEILEIMEDSLSVLTQLKSRYLTSFPELIISYGDTPSCSIADSFDGMDEIRPGNFVYYDVMQYHIGSCSLDDIAVAVACPIVAIHPNRNEMVIYGGGVHLSKESIEADNGFKLYGYIVTFSDNGWNDPIPGAYLKSVSQEHGIINLPANILSDFKPGDIIGILPIHSCMTANLLKEDSILI